MGTSAGAGVSPRLDGVAVRAAAVPDVVVAGVLLRRVFAGEPSQLGQVRRWLASFLPAGPVCDDVVLIATELGSNAVRHSASGRGGTFTVEVTCQPGTVRVSVSDGGGPAGPRLITDPAGENGRGLLVVRGLAADTGMTGDHRGRTVWGEVAARSASR